jgi:predicted nucleic acid-binding protein
VSYLLDTNVLGEVTRRTPDARVLAWLRNVPDGTLHVSVLTLGEIRKGVESLPHGERRERLRVWLEEDVPQWFEDRLLPVSAGVADRWGRLLAQVGRPVPAVDSLLAATALEHDLRMVTRNEADFDFPGLQVINPWNI